MNQKSDHNSQSGKRVLFGLVAFLILLILLYLFHPVFYVFLILFAGVLFALFISGLANLLKDTIHLSRGPALALIILILLIALGLTGWLAGAPLATQLAQLAKRLPEAVTIIESYLSRYQWGRYLLSLLPEPRELLPLGGGLLGSITGFFTTVIGVMASIILIFFIGVYLAIEPKLYIHGFLRLLPPEKRTRGREVFSALGRALRWWILGRAFSMIAVGVLTMIGLFIIGLPLAPALSIIAGLLTFVPYIGPLASAVPAILVALIEGPLVIVYVIIIYIIVQQLENHLITPLVQKRAVSIPPVVLLTAQLLIGILFGLFGLLLATPLAIVSIILVQMLYIENVLGEPVKILGNHSGSDGN